MIGIKRGRSHIPSPGGASRTRIRVSHDISEVRISLGAALKSCDIYETKYGHFAFSQEILATMVQIVCLPVKKLTLNYAIDEKHCLVKIITEHCYCKDKLPVL